MTRQTKGNSMTAHSVRWDAGRPLTPFAGTKDKLTRDEGRPLPVVAGAKDVTAKFAAAVASFVPVRRRRTVVPRPSYFTSALALLLFLSACTSGGIYTTVSPDPAVSATVKSEFPLASDYPAALVIPDIAGMQSTAFVVSTDNPSGIIAIDLDHTPLALSSQFTGCRLPAGTGIPTGAVAILSQHRALLLTSTHLIACDPTSGVIAATLSLDAPVQLAHALPLSRPFDLNGDGVAETTIQKITPSFPAGLAVAGNRVWVSFSNYVLATGSPVAAPGLVQSFTLAESAPILDSSGDPAIVTSAFNPSALRMIDDHTLLIVNSGVNAIVNGATGPLTTSGVDVVDLTQRTTQWLPLGSVALSFATPPISPDGTRVFLPSAAAGVVYVLDLPTRQFVRDAKNPIVVTSKIAGSDFLTNAIIDAPTHLLLVASFTHSAIYPVALDASYTVLPSGAAQPLILGAPAGVTAENPTGTNTGVGMIAMRPAPRDANSTDANLFAITAYPGKVVGAFVAPITIDEAAQNISPTTPTTKPSAGTSPTVANGVAPKPTPAAAPISAAPDPAGTTPSPTNPKIVDLPSDSLLPFADAVADYKIGTGGGFGSSKLPDVALGAPHGAGKMAGNTNSVLSLGCNGYIVLEMKDYIIADGPGVDFIVFENAFAGWAEPGVVGVSNDGQNFVEFPCDAQNAPYKGCAGVSSVFSNSGDNTIDPTDPLTAGGDAFDLAAVDMTTARFVRVRDAGCKALGGSTAGFDFDAISVVWGIVQ